MPLVVCLSETRSASIIGWRAGPVCFRAASGDGNDVTFRVASWKAGRAEDWVKLSVRQAAEPVCTGLSSAAKRRGDGRGGAGQGLRLRVLCEEGFQVLLVSGVSCVGVSAETAILATVLGTVVLQLGIGCGKNTVRVSFSRILFIAILLN